MNNFEMRRKRSTLDGKKRLKSDKTIWNNTECLKLDETVQKNDRWHEKPSDTRWERLKSDETVRHETEPSEIRRNRLKSEKNGPTWDETVSNQTKPSQIRRNGPTWDGTV